MKKLRVVYWWGIFVEERVEIDVELNPAKSFHVESGYCNGPNQLRDNPNVVVFPRHSHVTCFDVFDTNAYVYIHPNN